MWKVAFLTPAGSVWRSYHGDEARGRKIVESMERRHKWRMKQMIKQW